MSDPKITKIDRIVAELVEGNVSELEKNLQNIQMIKLNKACEIMDVSPKTMRKTDIPKVWISGNIHYRIIDLKEFINKQVTA